MSESNTRGQADAAMSGAEECDFSDAEIQRCANKILAADNAELRRRCDELLKACKVAVEIIRDSYGETEVDIPSDCQAVNVMVDAIAAAEAGTAQGGDA